ncbi:MAG: DUF2306 domain-containing protein [Candidatus Cohnella colombiensis]|uniref:DUF2306 domain-containing protein n=1 Tax=Candidatus Cohnella colombiensis TaxID=3121368 RepID=A0AA95EX06_9BACL|nr:MAG: DUF2306 domain-containing protein [Cohnella sp.]
MRVRSSSVRMWTFGILAFLAVAIGMYALILYGSPDRLREQPFTTEKGTLPALWYSVLCAHAISAGLALIIGWLQFVKKIRHRFPNIHRMIGYFYSAFIVIGGITGLYLAFYSNGGWSAHLGFAMLSTLWLYTLYRGINSVVMKRDHVEHGKWMIRNYALSCAAISLRLYTGASAGLLGLMDTNETFVVIAWLCWVPNLFIAELINSKHKRLQRPYNSEIRQ